MTKKKKEDSREKENRVCRIVFDILVPIEDIYEELDTSIKVIRKYLDDIHYKCDYHSQRVFFKDGDYKQKETI